MEVEVVWMVWIWKRWRWVVVERGCGRASVIGTVVSVEFHLQTWRCLVSLAGGFLYDGSLLKHAGYIAYYESCSPVSNQGARWETSGRTSTHCFFSERVPPQSRSVMAALASEPGDGTGADPPSVWSCISIIKINKHSHDWMKGNGQR